MATKKDRKLDPRTVRADGKGMTKEQRAARELALSDAMFVALTALDEKRATEWCRKADVLKAGLSVTAVKRAQKRAHAMADEHPAGFIEAMQSMDLVEEICADYGIERKDMDALYGAVAQLCMFQLAAGRGPFHRAASDFHLTAPRDHAAVPIASSDRIEVIRLRAQSPDGCGNPACPNCRPRKPEELN